MTRRARPPSPPQPAFFLLEWRAVTSGSLGILRIFERRPDEVARVIQERVLKTKTKKPDARAIISMIERIGLSSQPKAVDAMIDLLES